MNKETYTYITVPKFHIFYVLIAVFQHNLFSLKSYAFYFMPLKASGGVVAHPACFAGELPGSSC
jgi:hypothetical protein